MNLICNLLESNNICHKLEICNNYELNGKMKWWTGCNGSKLRWKHFQMRVLIGYKAWNSWYWCDALSHGNILLPQDTFANINQINHFAFKINSFQTNQIKQSFYILQHFIHFFLSNFYNNLFSIPFKIA